MGAHSSGRALFEAAHALCRPQVKGPKGDKAGGDVAREVEERSVSLVSSLLQVGCVPLNVY